MFPFGETVTIYRATTTVDAYGDDSQSGWSPAGVLSCACAPVSSAVTDTAGRVTTVSALDVYADHCVDLAPGDQIEWHGVRWQAAGRPQRWRSPFTGDTPGSVTRFELVEG